MPRVFISYRRDDSAAHAGRIYDRLRDHFGAEQVFRDIDAIAPGAKFAKVIAERIENCDALIAIIGKEWLHAEDGEGKRRLDDPDDWVKAEIREALTRDKLVIPALVEGARMRKDSELPAEIAALAGRHAIEISESRFDYDAERLLGALNGSPIPATFARSAAAAVRVVNTGSNNFFNIGVIGITLEQYDAGLKRREQEVRAELLQTNRPDKARVALLEKELAAVEAKRQNLEQSLADHKAKLAEAHQALEKFKGEVPADQLAQAQQALQKGDAAAAEKLFGDVVQSGKQQAAEAAFQLGALANNRIDYAKAYEHYSDAARLQPENPAYLNMAGRLAYETAHYIEAQLLLGKALAIREKSLAPEHPDVAQSLNNLAALYDSQGQYAQAELLYQRALKISEKSLGPEHPAVANSLNNLAEIYRAQGQYAQAEPLHQRALKIREKSLGPEHPDVAHSLNNLALLYHTQGQDAQAEPLYQRALKIWQKSLPADHPDLATGMENYATLLDKLGRKEEAQQWQAKAEATRQLHAQKNSKAR